MSNDDLRAMASSDASALKDRIASQAEVTDAGPSDDVLARALANALIIVVQEYLERTSDEYDIDIFLEANSRQPDDIASWPVTILAGLRMRRTPDSDLQTIFDRVVGAAAEYVRSRSSLAWGR